MRIRTVAIFTLGALLVSCSGGDKDVRKFIADTKKKTRGSVEALPLIKPPEVVSYVSDNLRSPFATSMSTTMLEDVASLSGEEKSVRDDMRKEEALEKFPLASLSLKGIIRSAGATWGLITDSQGYMHKVQVGNYIGHNSGRVVDITPSEVIIIEMWDDGSGNIEPHEKFLKLTN